MESLAFWHSEERRFRDLSASAVHLCASRSIDSPESYVAEEGRKLVELVRIAIRNPDYSIDAIANWARSLARIARWIIDGEYICRWIISGDGADNGQPLALLKRRLRAEAAVAASGAGLVRPPTSIDEAVDRWLDLVEQSGNPFVRDAGWIESVAEASAVMCAELASRVHEPPMIAEVSARGGSSGQQTLAVEVPEPHELVTGKPFGDVIDLLRQECAWSVETLADKVSLDRSSVVHHLTGRKAP